MAEGTYLTPKVSIIVPVYNVEQYLRRCLDSIVAQTFTEWECILIDDGSLDNSGEICDEYVEKDSRFRVIHQDNAGVSAARNSGLEAAIGDWIGFVDSDDWIEFSCLEKMYHLIESTKAKLVLCKISDEVHAADFSDCKAYEYADGKYGVAFQSCWGKLFNKEVLDTYNLRFPESVRLGEDTVFTFKYLVYVSNYSCTDLVCYHYCNANQNGVCNTLSITILEDTKNCFLQLEEYLKKNGCFSRFEQNLFSLKKYIKNQFLFSMNTPYVKGWRTAFPEINHTLITDKKTSLKLRLVYIMILLHIDFFVVCILKLYHNNKLGDVK